MNADLLDADPGLIDALGSGLPRAKDWALANTAEAGALAEKTLQMRAPIFEKALPAMNLDICSARAAKTELVDFYETLIALSPDALAGKVPRDDFDLDF